MLRISYYKIKAKRLGIDSFSPVSMWFLRSLAEVKTRSASDIEQEKAREGSRANTSSLYKYDTSSAFKNKKTNTHQYHYLSAFSSTNNQHRLYLNFTKITKFTN